MVDRAIESLSFPDSYNFPKAVNFAKHPNYLKVFEKAKEFAMGQQKSLSTAYTKERLRRFCQDDFNANIWIPSVAVENVLYLPDASDPDKFNRMSSFTLGELVALYGDYRKMSGTTGNPFEPTLTSAALKGITFDKANHPDLAPRKTPYQDYLRYIASGVFPPVGCGGNRTGNTARDDEFEEAGWWGDDMLRSANINDWHFSDGAVGWYTGMHRLALRSAVRAQQDPRYWVLAFHYEANALHSFTDLFAFGHVVTNRGQTSYEILLNNGELRKTPYKWMEGVMRLGGCTRNANGSLSLDAELPEGDEPSKQRNDFIRTDAGVRNVFCVLEKKLHDDFNGSGATVKNLKGDVFTVKGDGGYPALSDADKEVIAEGIRRSVLSLLLAYQANPSDPEIIRPGSGYFSALGYVPVYIVKDANGHFTGQFASYAGFVSDLNGDYFERRVPEDWQDCKIKFMSGQHPWKPRRNQPLCTEWE